MRFPANRISAIRRGKLTIALRPFEGMSGFRVGHYFAIQSVEDVPYLWESVEPDQRPEGSQAGDTVYLREVTTLEDWIKIDDRWRCALDQLGEDTITAAGFDCLKDLVDHFRADYGGSPFQTVWVFEFVHADGIHRLEGLPDEPEGVDPPTLAAYVVENRQGDLMRHAKRRQRWERQQIGLRLSAVEPEAVRQGLHHELARARAAVEDIERKLRRKAA